MPEKRQKTFAVRYLFCYEKCGPKESVNSRSGPDDETLLWSANAMIPDTQIPPEVQAEPPEWHLYKALVTYRYKHPEATDNHVYLVALAAAHDAYIERFIQE